MTLKEPHHPPYRNLRVWAESFNLALDIFQMTRRLEGAEARTLTKRLIHASSRMPVAVARGQSSGSATEFIRCLHEGLSELSDLETHLLMCGELGYLPAEEIRAYELRLGEIRRMASGLIRRLRASARGGGGPTSADELEERPVVTRIGSDGAIRKPSGGEKGSALLMALLVSTILGILGLGLLQIADGESRISAGGRDRDQLMNVAEAGARAVKRWFDAPISGDPSSSTTVRHAFLGRLDLRAPVSFIRSRRLIEADGNPATPPVAADGSPGREWYRQGREIASGMPHLDFFQKPFGGGAVTALLGTEDGPDIVLEDQPGRVDLLDELNASLFQNQDQVGRIERIEIFGPMRAPAGSVAARLGAATVRITAAKYRRLDSSAGVPVVPPGDPALARAVLRMGLAEIPAGSPRGPLESCGDITAAGRLRVRWGRVIAAGDITLADRIDRLDSYVASAFPYASFGRHISGSSAGGDLADWLSDPDLSVEDPWLKVVAGGDLIGWETLPDQPLPYDQARAIDYDHSNLFQRVPGVTCPWFDYGLWKSIALERLAGDPDVHYFSFDPATGLFREMGRGPARSLRDWTHGRSGIFFFDTADGNNPGPSNLTPPIVISGGDWSTSGIIYLNADSFRATGVRGTDRVLLPPGEPFDDPDHDLIQDPTETFINLHYATAIGSGTATDDMLKESIAAQTGRGQSPDGEVYERSTTTRRDPGGIPVVAPVNLFGVLFNSGKILAEGDAVTYGSLVAGDAVVQATFGADSPIIYFDERLNTGEWPPAEIAIPRTYVTFWQTSRP